MEAQKQDFGNRFEGAFVNDGNPDLDVLGFLRTPVEFGPAETISVTFYLPVVSSSAGVLIEAQELVKSHAYFMQSKPFPLKAGGWNSFRPWPAKDVLIPLDIDAANLAVSASYIDEAGRRVYLPVVARGNSSPASNTYTIQFRTAWNIHSLRKTLTGPDGRLTTLLVSECNATPTCVLYDASSSHEVVLDMANRVDGMYNLRLEGSVPNRFQPVKATITFYHERS